MGNNLSLDFIHWHRPHEPESVFLICTQSSRLGRGEDEAGIKSRTVNLPQPSASLGYFQQMGNCVVLLIEFPRFANDPANMVAAKIFIIFYPVF